MQLKNNQRGIALPLVLLLIIVLVLLGFGLSVFGYYEATSAIREEHMTRAFYIARGSLAALSRYLTVIPGDVTENSLQVYQENVSLFVDNIISSGSSGLRGFYQFGTNTYGELNNFKITAQKCPDAANPLIGKLLLTSTGTSGKFSNVAQFELSYTLTEYKPFGLIDCALFTNTTADADYGKLNDYGKYKAKANGKVVAKKDPASPTLIPDIERDIHVDVIGGDPAYIDTHYIIPELRNYRVPRELVFSGTIIEKGDLVVNGKEVWTNPGLKSEKVIYHCNSLRINSGGSIVFNNPGMVIIIVDGAITISGNIGCADTGTAATSCSTKKAPYTHAPNCWKGRVNIIANGTQDIVIGGGAFIRANIISLRADVAMDITSTGTPTLSGNIIAGTAGEINFTGDFEGDSLVYAPNAAVTIRGSSGTFRGSVIANSFDPNAFITLTYAAIPRSTLPIWYGADATGNLDDEENLGTDEYYITNLVADRWR